MARSLQPVKSRWQCLAFYCNLKQNHNVYVVSETKFIPNHQLLERHQSLLLVSCYAKVIKCPLIPSSSHLIWTKRYNTDVTPHFFNKPFRVIQVSLILRMISCYYTVYILFCAVVKYFIFLLSPCLTPYFWLITKS